MNKEGIYTLLKHLNAKHISMAQKKWVTSSCPLAPWTHAGGQDTKPGFGVRIDDTGQSTYNCFTCSQKANMNLTDLMMLIGSYVSQDGSNYHNVDLKAAMDIVLSEDDYIDDPLAAIIAGFTDYESDECNHEVVLSEFPESWLNSFSSAKGLPYAYSRGLTDEIIDAFGVKYDSFQKRICFPMRDFGGVLRGLHGRAISNDNDLRYYNYEYEGKRNPSVWVGEHLCDLNKPVVLTEGFFDQTQIYQAYPNVLASRSSSISEDMFKRIEGANWLITYYDYGVGGDKARAAIDKRLGGRRITHFAPTEQEDDAGNTPVSVIREALDSLLFI